MRAVGSLGIVAADFNPLLSISSIIKSTIGTEHPLRLSLCTEATALTLITQFLINELKSVVTKYFEPAYRTGRPTALKLAYVIKLTTMVSSRTKGKVARQLIQTTTRGKMYNHAHSPHDSEGSAHPAVIAVFVFAEGTLYARSYAQPATTSALCLVCYPHKTAGRAHCLASYAQSFTGRAKSSADGAPCFASHTLCTATAPLCAAGLSLGFATDLLRIWRKGQVPFRECPQEKVLQTNLLMLAHEFPQRVTRARKGGKLPRAKTR
jgi:hypothetical protein